MITKSPLTSFETAVYDFKRARKQAALQQLLAKISGKSAELISYEAVYPYLNIESTIESGLQEIPLAAIVGSVGRYKDFTRGFLPKRDSSKERWANVKAAVTDMVSFPPIELYQIGEVYFVIDGNHRVSVARQLGSKTISAHVTKIPSRVTFRPEDDLDELICKARYDNFLAQTSLDTLYPDADLFMTFSGQYRLLIRQIQAQHYLLQQEHGADVPFADAVKAWYEKSYLPIIKLIRQQGILRLFPNRTETDIYVFVSEKQAQIEKSLGWHVDLEAAVSELRHQEKPSALTRMRRRLLSAVWPKELADGPPPGQWRKNYWHHQALNVGREDRLFADYLVLVRGRDEDWTVVDRAIRMAKMEGDRLLGLHVVPDAAQIDSPETAAIKAEFQRRCEAAAVAGELAIDAGKLVDTVVKRAVWADIVMIQMRYPEGDKILARLNSNISQLIQHCPRPLLVVPAGFHELMRRILVGYDGSPKAQEALFVAAYFAARWPVSLVLLTVETAHTAPSALAEARAYLEAQGVKNVTYVLEKMPIAEAMMATAAAEDCNFIVMGGFGFRPLLHVVLGSTVDRILREHRYPVLICR